MLTYQSDIVAYQKALSKLYELNEQFIRSMPAIFADKDKTEVFDDPVQKKQIKHQFELLRKAIDELNNRFTKLFSSLPL